MAYPDYGAFLPTEALYTEPGAYSGVLRGEALKRASYLSEMDRFHEELKESSRRFEKQYTLAERELEFTEEQALWEREFTEEQAVKKEEFEKARFTHEKAITRMGIGAQREAGGLQYKLGMEQLEFQREIEAAKMPEEEEWEIAAGYLREMDRPTRTVGREAMPQERPTEISTGGWLEQMEKAYPETEKSDKYRTFMGRGSTISEVI